ncbi:heme-binding protein [Pseudomonadales bacterium]|nr:heme-binding protein [Pseudomonadales bacterium]
MLKETLKIFSHLTIVLLAACGGSESVEKAPMPQPSALPPDDTLVAAKRLLPEDVAGILDQAIEQMIARGATGVVSISDRVGNILAVSQHGVSTRYVQVAPGPGAETASGNVGLQSALVPRTAVAISKAVTGAYVSSGGNAFSTRTASMIIQPHFPPTTYTVGLESGPLFGLQFSQLACSDVMASAETELDHNIGPRKSPLGMSADPGGFPLYKEGVLVGGIGVSTKAIYGFDDNVEDFDEDIDEAIALLAASHFLPPAEIRADKISVDGTLLRYSDAALVEPASNLVDALAQSDRDLIDASLISVPGYFDSAQGIKAGQQYGQEGSGVRPSTLDEFAIPGAFILSDGAGRNRFPIKAAADGNGNEMPLTQDEVRQLLETAHQTMSAARGQIRRPLNQSARVSMVVVDTTGEILGLVIGSDAPIFGLDVAVQKARTATFFSSELAATYLVGLNRDEISDYVQRVRVFLNDPKALTGQHAFSDRAGGNLSRPYFPDGELGRPHGPLSRPITEWSPFATGLQESLVRPEVVKHLGFVDGTSDKGAANECVGLLNEGGDIHLLGNGIQIFPGSVPIYRGSTLIGGIGVSGDGVDQDDMIAFLSVHRVGEALGTLGNAPKEIRADTIEVDNVRLRYISCPFNPFLDESEQEVCNGK